MTQHRTKTILYVVACFFLATSCYDPYKFPLGIIGDNPQYPSTWYVSRGTAEYIRTWDSHDWAVELGLGESAISKVIELKDNENGTVVRIQVEFHPDLDPDTNLWVVAERYYLDATDSPIEDPISEYWLGSEVGPFYPIDQDSVSIDGDNWERTVVEFQTDDADAIGISFLKTGEGKVRIIRCTIFGEG